METSKHYFLSLLFFLFSCYTFSQSLGPNSPSSAISSSSPIIGRSWASTSEVYVNDNVYSNALLNTSPTCTGNSTCYTTEGLSSSGFGFSIPGTASITGIVVEIKRRTQGATANQVYDSTFMLMNNGVPVGTNEASAIAWTGTAAYVTYGSSSDLWGATWTPSDINNANFGLYLAARNTSSSISPQVGVDHIRITVYYSIATRIYSAASGSKYSIYPNPVSSGFVVKTKNYINSIAVYNIMGEVVYSNNNQGQEISVDLSNYPKGVYFVKVYDANQNHTTEKIVLE